MSTMRRELWFAFCEAHSRFREAETEATARKSLRAAIHVIERAEAEAEAHGRATGVLPHPGYFPSRKELIAHVVAAIKSYRTATTDPGLDRARFDEAVWLTALLGAAEAEGVRATQDVRAFGKRKRAA